jgi:sorbitol-specific phosphotransferase system component IIBC
VLPLAFLATAVYAVVNAFGAWAVIRRKQWMAALFMLAASVLTVAAVAMVTDLPFTRVLLGAGLVLASLTSLLNAQVVLGKIVWRNHAYRAAFALAIYLLADIALP